MLKIENMTINNIEDYNKIEKEEQWSHLLPTQTSFGLVIESSLKECMPSPAGALDLSCNLSKECLMSPKNFAGALDLSCNLFKECVMSPTNLCTGGYGVKQVCCFKFKVYEFY